MMERESEARVACKNPLRTDSSRRLRDGVKRNSKREESTSTRILFRSTIIIRYNFRNFAECCSFHWYSRRHSILETRIIRRGKRRGVVVRFLGFGSSGTGLAMTAQVVAGQRFGK